MQSNSQFRPQNLRSFGAQPGIIFLSQVSTGLDLHQSAIFYLQSFYELTEAGGWSCEQLSVSPALMWCLTWFIMSHMIYPASHDLSCLIRVSHMIYPASHDLSCLVPRRLRTVDITCAPSQYSFRASCNLRESSFRAPGYEVVIYLRHWWRDPWR
jgi:hypothetical protein